MRASPIWVISGPRQAGKTSFCRRIAELARQAGWDVAGLLSPAQFEQEIKTGILAEDLRTGIVQPLASITRQNQDDLAFGDWYFHRRTLEWGNRVLAISLPCDLLIVDELGPLELTHHMGWQVALDILPRAAYRLALVVIRPELQAVARSMMDFSSVVEIDQSQPTNYWVRKVQDLIIF